MRSATDYSPNDRVYTYVWAGGETAEPIPLTVIRVNKQTITVRTDEGIEQRIPSQDIVGRWKLP